MANLFLVLFVSALAVSSAGSDNATCTLTNMTCYLPGNLSLGYYKVKGNETADEDKTCGISGSSTARFFTIDFIDCNVSVDSGSEFVVYEATLVSRWEKGKLELEPRDWPDVVCRCDIDVRTNVTHGGVVVVVDEVDDLEVTGSLDFTPELRVYPNSSYVAGGHIGAGGDFPAESQKFYVEVISDEENDFIGLEHCYAGPTNKTTDPFLEVFLGADPDSPGCVPGSNKVGYVEQVAEGERHFRKFSTTKFKFAGFEEVYFSCTVKRCASDAVVCVDMAGCGRRLDGDNYRMLAEEDASDRSQAANVFSVTAGPGTQILPAAMPKDLYHLIWDREVLDAKGTIRSNITLYGCPADDADKLAAVLEKLINSRFSATGKHPQLLRIWKVGNAEAAVVEFAIQDVDGHDASMVENHLVSMLQSINGNKTFTTELLSVLGAGHSSGDALIQAEWSPLVFTPMAASTTPAQGSANFALTLGPMVAVHVAFVMCLFQSLQQ